jgi:predicted kinase
VDLVVLVGLPATGKSSFYRDRFAATHAHISKDLLSVKRGKEVRQRRLLVAALRAGQHVVVDNTNPRRADRALLIALGRAHGARVVGFYFASRIAECLARNQLRVGRARVPDQAIFSIAKVLERPVLAEGFDALFHVTLDASPGDYTVAPWREEVP